jgi:phosphopantetheinyl transferase
MGIDLELIEERSMVFQQDYFTVEELRQIEGLPEKDRAFSTTLIWSGKEAVLKALSLGLRIDTRKIGIGIHQGTSLYGWSEIDILYKENLRLFWRREDRFLLTICVGGNVSADFQQIHL